MEYNIKKAFTLAEVLITLMVIGILAMVTLPSLMQSLEKTVLKNQAKKALSILSQALYEATSEEGDIKCYYSGDANVATANSNCLSFFNDNFLKKLKIIKTCTGTYTLNGCIPDYHLPEELTGCSYFNPSYTKIAYILSDGTILIMYGKGYVSVFWVDVNGIKPPNKPYQDLLGLSIYKKSTGEYFFDNKINSCFNFPIENTIYFRYKSDLFK